MASLVMNLAGIGLMTLLASGVAGAASDPTRPPEAWLGQQEGGGELTNAGSPRLQSVLMPQRGRPVAIIGGRTVPLGARFGDAVLIRLSEHEAVLQGAEGVTRLYLTPDVDKRMIVAPVANKARRSAQGKESQ